MGEATIASEAKLINGKHRIRAAGYGRFIVPLHLRKCMHSPLPYRDGGPIWKRKLGPLLKM
ncbi:hypothetical protein YTPLAS18_20140 [Nitrospira sp.]|nr:hypothetical protein YTPLAS18_20140 [Nitrospira sp.]